MTKFSRILSESGEWPKYETLPDGTQRIETKHEIEYIDSDNNYHRVDGPAHTYKLTKIKLWYLHGVLHRTDGPARTNGWSGEQQWYFYGKLHRIDGPAWVDKRKGEERYYINGRLLSKEEFEKHFNIKESNPGSVNVYNKVTKLPNGGERYENNTVVWYDDKEGRFHREDGPAIKSDSLEQWYLHGELHRVGGPASITYNGEVWYRNGVLHRTDGPAVYNRSFNHKEYWVNGKEFSEEEFYRHFGDD